VHLGLVVPKRHARRAVTRNLVKRQVRACWQGWWREAARSWPGFDTTDWVVRLRAPIDRKLYLSARSDDLAMVLRLELPDLLQSGLKSLMRAQARLTT
jgi:ribonuclease P protein component